MNPRNLPTCRRLRSTLTAALLVAVATAAHAASTAISNVPISSTRAAQAKPNVMLLMDTSDSMAFTHMPDEVEDLVTPGSVGYKNWQCNSLYYNPNTIYNKLPRRYDGGYFPQGNFGNALVDAFDSNSTDNRDLGIAFQAYNNGSSGAGAQSVRKPTWAADTPQAAYYYVYQGTQQLSYGQPPCNDPDLGSDRPATGGGMWRRVVVGSEQQNFANWYVYSRTRMLLTKTAVSLSFNSLNESQRVGFITVDPKVGAQQAPAINSDKFLPLGDFFSGPGNQRDKWYSKLFSQKPGGTSPTREGLARVGRYYGNKFDGINQGMGGVDPMQFTCQQNVTILTTDGYWNAQREATSGSLGGGFIGGGVNLAGTGLVGQQDGALTTDPNGDTPPGVWDGFAESLKTETDRLNTFSDIPCVANNVPYASQTQTLASYRSYTQTATQYQKSTHQLKSRTRYDSTVTDVYKQSSKQYELYTDRYNTQTLEFAIASYQSTYKRVPFTTKTTTLWSTEVKQLIEATSTIQQTDTPWTKRLTDQYQTTAVQWLAATHVDEAKTSIFRQEKIRKTTQEYQIIKTENGEIASLASSCTPVTGQVECEEVPLGPPVPAPGECNSTVGTPPGPQFIFTRCTTIPVAPLIALPQPCEVGTVIDPQAPHVRTICTEEVVNELKAVSGCTAEVTLGSNSNITVCKRRTLTQATPVDTSSVACPNGQNATSFVTTVCTAGPLAHGPQGSAPCSGTQYSNSPDYVITSCTYSGPTTTYVQPGLCTDQTGTQQNGWVPNVVCTPGAPLGPRYTAGCTPQTLGTAGTDSAVQVTCSSLMDVTSTAVASCTGGPGVSFDQSPPYTRRSCSNSGSLAHPPQPSAECQEGTQPPGTPFFTETTCAKSGPTVTYVPAASQCQMRVASAGNGGETTTCSTPPEDPEVDGACSGGVTGVDAGQATIVCGSRLTQETPVQSCDVNAVPVDLGGGLSTSCALVVGPAVAGPQCNEGDTYNSTPPYVGARCNRVQQTRYVDPPCTDDGSVTPADINNGWTRSTCNVRNQTAEVAVASCNPNVINVSPGPAFVNTSCTKTPVPALTGPVNGTCSPAGPTFDGSKTTVCSQTYSSAQPEPVETCALGIGTVRDTGPNFGLTTCNDFPTQEFVADLSPGNCTAIATKAAPYWMTVECDTLTNTDYSAQCTDGASSYSGAPLHRRVVCSAPPGTPPVADGCSVGTTYDPITKVTKECTEQQYSASVPANCTPSAPPAAPVGPDWITTRCTLQSGLGVRRQYAQTETTRTARYSGAIRVGPETTTGPTTIATADYDGGVCHIAGVNPIDALPSPVRPTSGMTAPCTQWPCTVTQALEGGSANSLADVAQYYYVTDLRPNMVDDVLVGETSGALDDRKKTQHMTTFTVALGVSGTLGYRPDYRDPAGDFADVVAMTRNWPEWPDRTIDYVNPSNDGSTGVRRWEDPRSIDDFWHTATNGRGRYFNANDPGTAAAGLSDALLGVGATTAAGAAGGVTTLEPVAGNNTSFEASYSTAKWSGELVAKRISISDATLSDSSNWSKPAGQQLLARVKALCDTRDIYLLRPGTTPALVDFSFGTKKCDAAGDPAIALADGLNASEKAFFGSSAVLNLSHYQQMTDLTPFTPDQKTPAAGANLVNFIRGQNGFEGFQSGDASRLYRRRDGPLGDIVHAQPVYVAAPFATYNHDLYSDFKSQQLNRKPMVYVAANDGMLHAFYAGDQSTSIDPDGGKEAWAVIPSTVLPDLYHLADNNYKNVHRFYVDGTPTVGDAFIGGQWKTMLVGGLNSGGRGYYALDVTDPQTPRALWEFNDPDLGLTFGKPVITKVNNAWVVMFTSGYNNLSGGTPGGGFLYMVNALNGALLQKIPTNAGDVSTPSNLGQINNFVDDAMTNNATLRVYGSDMLGNTWRFNVTDASPTATLLLQATTGGNPQPITIKPEIAELNGKPIIFVGTGRFLGDVDIEDTQVQSIYGIVDPLDGTTVTRSELAPLAMTTSGSGTSLTRTIACTGSTLECGSTRGWVVDLPILGERVNVDVKLAVGTLVVASNTPGTNPCEPGGTSVFNYLNFATGLPVPGYTNVSQYLAGALTVGFNVVLVNGRYYSENRLSDAKTETDEVPVGSPNPRGKRISWREIVVP